MTLAPRRSSTAVRLGLALIGVALVGAPVQTARASVVRHHVTPRNVATTDGIEVRVERRANGDVVLTLSVDPAPEAVYEPQLRTRAGGPQQTIAWVDADAQPLVAVVVVRSADVARAEVSVMRDFGLIGHRYELFVREWARP